ncbi:hypothetical protein AC578_8574 [Pseudocercospora eumusae]|uniref:Uncharacterized protein n=1 Tax=Pseudocercospora eumusae TaxID=321146 RepID=A0A139HW41_9PEZI|nr:hypothetical protein AC578_8574 [Pseudocercospora eumusae]
MLSLEVEELMVLSATRRLWLHSPGESTAPRVDMRKALHGASQSIAASAWWSFLYSCTRTLVPAMLIWIYVNNDRDGKEPREVACLFLLASAVFRIYFC